MLDIITDAWHVEPLRLRITNRTEMLASRLLLDEENDTTDMLCTNKMRTLVLDRPASAPSLPLPGGRHRRRQAWRWG
jgi:hypothetical protein